MRIPGGATGNLPRRNGPHRPASRPESPAQCGRPKISLEPTHRAAFYCEAVMKKAGLVLLVLILAVSAPAGILGWLTASSRMWEFIQLTGGIRIAEPVISQGQLVLPVEYDASGSRAITRSPAGANSGLVVRSVQARLKPGHQIVIWVVTQVAEKDSPTGWRHHAELKGIPPGTYEVYYADAGDPGKFLGKVAVN